MSIRRLSSILEPAPPQLREQIIGYARSVDAAAADIFEDADVPFDEELAEDLVLLAGLRRLWSIVDGQYWIVANSLHLLSDHNISEVGVGGSIYGYGTRSFQQIRDLRDQFQRLLRELNVLRLVEAGSPADLLVLLAEESGHGR